MEALYNKYRPQIFEDVVGQEHIERTIKNALAANKISHAYMFIGPRGTGKTTTARLLAKALLCKDGPTPDPDGTCEDCKLIASGEHPDVYELDAASRTGVENVREEIIGKVDYAPTRGKFKVYIIDEVHMLSVPAFNALLKTLEEPPDHVIFIMCTTDPQKIPETIFSRCQRFDFRRISSEELVSRLGAICEMEGIEFEGDALDLIAHRAQGGMRDALTSLEQLIAFGDGKVTMDVAERLLGSIDSSDLAEIVKAIGTRDVAACFNWTSSYMETGADLAQFVGDLTSHVRDMYVMSLAGADVALDVTQAGRRELQVELEWFGPERLARMLEVLGDLVKELKTSTNQRLSFEIALTRMVRPESDLTLSSLSERIEALERELKEGKFERRAASSSLGQVVTPSTQLSDSAESVSSDVDKEETAAQEPSVEDVSPASIYEGNINAQQVWNTVMAHLKKIGPAYGVVFMNTSVYMDADLFVIEFSKNNDFAFKASSKQDARGALEKAFSRAGYPGIKYKITQSKGSVDRGSSASDAVSRSQDISKPKEFREVQEPSEVNEAKEAAEVQKVAEVLETHNAQEAAPTPEVNGAQEEENTQKAKVSESNPDPDFQDFISATFGEGVVVEEVKE